MGWQKGMARRLLGERQSLLGILFAFSLGFAGNGAICAGNVAQQLLGTAEWQIGLITAAQALGIAAAAPLMWILSRAKTPANLPVLACIVTVAGFLGVAIHQHWMLAVAARFIFGCGVGLGVAFAEYTVISKVRSDMRPLMVALFGLAVGAGHLMGTLLTQSLGLWEVRVAICALILASALLIRPWGRTVAAQMPASFGEIPRLVKALPVTFAAAILFGFLDNGFLAMLPSYAMGLGLTAGDVTTMSFWAFAGILIFQLPAGFLCAAFNPETVLRAGALAAILCVMALSMTIGLPVSRHFFVFVLGGLVDIFYTVGLVVLAGRLPRQHLAIGNACFVSMCGIGEVAGPLIIGQTAFWFGPQAILGFLAMLLAVYWFCSVISGEMIVPEKTKRDRPPGGVKERRASDESAHGDCTSHALQIGKAC